MANWLEQNALQLLQHELGASKGEQVRERVCERDSEREAPTDRLQLQWPAPVQIFSYKSCRRFLLLPVR